MPHWKKRETVFAEYEVGLTMPGNWQLRLSPDPDRWFYRSADHKEHLTIARGEFTEGEGEVGVRRAVARNRRAVELGFGRVPDLILSEPEYGERLGVPSSTYGGTAGEGAHQFWALLLFPDRAVWSFFYEAFKLPEVEAETRAQVILDSIVLRDFPR